MFNVHIDLCLMYTVTCVLAPVSSKLGSGHDEVLCNLRILVDHSLSLSLSFSLNLSLSLSLSLCLSLSLSLSVSLSLSISLFVSLSLSIYLSCIYMHLIRYRVFCLVILLHQPLFSIRSSSRLDCASLRGFCL